MTLHSSYADSSNMDGSNFEYTSMKNLNESKYGFWGVLARKAKAFVDEDDGLHTNATGGQFQKSYRPPEGHRKAEAPFRKSSDRMTSLNHIGGKIKNALEGGLTIVENRTADIIQETRKLRIRRKGSGQNSQNQAPDKLAQHNFPHVQADLDTQLKAARDVANAMAAKAKLLLRELKNVKADLAFAKERCAQLEEENTILRESYQKGASNEDDDLIRLQLETLLAEKGRLAHENSIYARENRFLREIVEYHQLTMQDVVYMDEGIEEVTEVFYPGPNQILSRTKSISNSNLSHGSVPSSAPPSPAAPMVPSPSTKRPPEIVVPELCPVIPVPPTPSPQYSTGVVLPRTGASLPRARQGIVEVQ